MVSITRKIEQLLRQSAYQSVNIRVVLSDGSTIPDITSADIVSGSFSIQRDSVSGDTLETGNMTSSELSLTLLNEDGKFDGIVFDGAILTCTIFIHDSATGSKYSIPAGEYIVDEHPRVLDTVKLSALDNTIKLDQVFKYDGIFPTSERLLVTTGLEACGVRYKAEDILKFSDELNIENFVESLQQDVTWRQIIMWICQFVPLCGYADEFGQVRFGFYDSTQKPFQITERDRFTNNSNYGENDTVITGHQFKDGDKLYPVDVEQGYVLVTDDNILFSAQTLERKQAIANKVNDVLKGLRYRSFTASTPSFPHLFPLDAMSYKLGDSYYPTFLTSINFSLNGGSNLESSAKTKEDNNAVKPSTWTPKQHVVISNIDKNIKQNTKDITARDQVIDGLNNTAAGSMGLFHTEIKDSQGGTKYYWHDQPTLEESMLIYLHEANGAFFTNTGWNNGNPHWQTGTDKFGNAVVNLLNAIGIQAEWIRAGSIATDKLAIGQAERGTNLLEDSSFEANVPTTQGKYNEETGLLEAPAFNEYWTAVTTDDSDAFTTTDAGYLYPADVGGFDGNKAIWNVNQKGLAEGVPKSYESFLYNKEIPISLITHTLSMYYKNVSVVRNDDSKPPTHVTFITKIDWLDSNKDHLDTFVWRFGDTSDANEGWKRAYTTLTPPNKTSFAKFLIGFTCTDNANEVFDPDTGEFGYEDLALVGIDGILFEQGNVLNDWTCAESERTNSGVIIDSNGLQVAQGKISVKDPFNRNVLYTDGQQALVHNGSFISSIYNPTVNKTFAKMKAESDLEPLLYDDTGDLLGQGDLGLLFEKLNLKTNRFEQVSHVSQQYSNDPNIDNNRPLDFYSTTGFSFSEGSFTHGFSHPLISDPQKVDAGTNLLEYATPGFYYCDTPELAESMFGMPQDLKGNFIKQPFFLKVWNIGETVYQLFYAERQNINFRSFNINAEHSPYWDEYQRVNHPYLLKDANIDFLRDGIFLQDDKSLIKTVQSSRPMDWAYPIKEEGVLMQWGCRDNGSTPQMGIQMYFSVQGHWFIRYKFTAEKNWSLWK